MMAVVMPYASEYFITPMAAVAGAVAEEILAVMLQSANLSRAYVNNGGDIALFLARIRKVCRRDGGASGSSIAFRDFGPDFGRSCAWNCDQRMARPKFFHGNRGCGDGSRGSARPQLMRRLRSSPMLSTFRDIRRLSAFLHATLRLTAISRTGW